MAQFDVYADGGTGGYLLDVQTDILRDLNTRLVVPLMLADRVPPALKRLNPQFEIDGRRTTMATQLMAAIPAPELRHRVGTLKSERYVVLGAIDFLLTAI